MLPQHAKPLRRQVLLEELVETRSGHTPEKRLAGGSIVTCEVRVFSLEVKSQQKHWPEKEEREFHWFSPSGAANAVQEPALGDIIRSFSKTKQPT
jgi:hypothetical protein